MAAAATDLLQKVGIQSATTLDANYTINDTTITVVSTSGWPSDTGITFAMDEIDSNGLQVAGTYNEFVGTVSTATSITNVDYADGTGDRNYTAGATTRVYIPVSKTRENRIVTWGLEEHNQDGTHGAITATSIDAGSATFDSVTIAGTASAEGWSPLGATPNTVTANGNRSYDLVFNSTDLTDTLSPGMRLKATRTVTAPTQCADLEASSSQYFSKTSPAGMTFTDDFTCMAWVKLESYTLGGIIARRNADTEGWSLTVNANGTVSLLGLRIAGNNRRVNSSASLPLGKWVHVAANLDMSGNTGAIYFDGIETPSSMSTSGTATALVQGTTALVVGAEKSDGTNPFDGKIAQAAVFSAQLSDATVKAMATQTYTGSETNVVSAFSLNNTLNDLSANANNLTANGGAVATDTDSPFSGGSVGTTEYGIVTAATFSTNTTLTVQVPEGYALPTSGGISAVSYSINKIPYGFPVSADKWEILTIDAVDRSTTSTSYATLTSNIIVPIGAWELSLKTLLQNNLNTTNNRGVYVTLSSDASTETNSQLTIVVRAHLPGAGVMIIGPTQRTSQAVTLTSQTTFTFMGRISSAGATCEPKGADTPTVIRATCNYL